MFCSGAFVYSAHLPFWQMHWDRYVTPFRYTSFQNYGCTLMTTVVIVGLYPLLYLLHTQADVSYN